MAKRSVFLVNNTKPYYTEINTEFIFYSGFALSQKQKSIDSLHKEFLKNHPDKRVLEISTKSPELLGRHLSAFNLLYTDSDGRQYPVESMFQSGKCFEDGTICCDLKDKSPYIAKKDIHLRTNAKLMKFSLNGVDFPLYPKTFFYDWLYVNALYQNRFLSDEIINYVAFTDIEFNAQKSINCQARSCAIFVSLQTNGLLLNALQSKDDFLHIVYNTETEQLSFFNKY